MTRVGQQVIHPATGSTVGTVAVAAEVSRFQV
jgi:hypothetical protein